MLYSRDKLNLFKSFTNELPKMRQKDLISDHQNIANDNKTRVFEYQNSLIEKNQSILHGEEIYKNYENRKLYLDQIRITKEKLEINPDADKKFLGEKRM